MRYVLDDDTEAGILKTGNISIAINGDEVTSARDVAHKVRNAKDGYVLSITLYRGRYIVGPSLD